MTTLAEIQAAIDALPTSETQLLLVYVATRLKTLGAGIPDLPVLPVLPCEQMVDWMAEDEAAMRRFHPNA